MGSRFRSIWVNVIAAEFDADASRGVRCEGGVKFVAAIAFGDMKHEISSMQFHRSENVGSKKHSGAKNFGGKFDGAIEIPDDQVEA
jgi:hypothetical protein